MDISFAFWISFAFALVSKQAQCFPIPLDFNGVLSRWPLNPNTTTVYYELHNGSMLFLDNTHYRVIDRATRLWSEVETSYLELERATDENPAQITINILPTEDSQAAGYSYLDELDDKNRPVHCSVYLYWQTLWDTEHFAKTLLHELGHCLGLGHSLIPEAIMGYDLDKSSFGLDIDDQAALSALYPISGETPKLPQGCGITSNRKGHILFWIPLLLLYLSRNQKWIMS